MTYVPYSKQAEFHVDRRERLLLAGNQCGSTTAGANEAAFHLTGLYPDWWTGHRFSGPVEGWIASVTHEVTMDHPWRALEPLINTQDIVKRKDGSIDTAYVGPSTLRLKSFEQDRSKWESGSPDFIWLEDEPPLDLYEECLLRIGEHGLVWITETPIYGYTDLLKRLLNSSCHMTRLSVFDAPHFTDEEKEYFRSLSPERSGVAGPTLGVLR